MGFLKHETRKIDLGESYWVEVKKLTYGEQSKVEDAAVDKRVGMRTPTNGQQAAEQEILMRIDPRASDMETLVLGIVGWNLTDEHDQPLPLEPEKAKRASLERLPKATAEQIVAEIVEFNAPREGDEQVRFRDRDDGGDPQRDGRTGDPREVLAGSPTVVPARPAAG